MCAHECATRRRTLAGEAALFTRDYTGGAGGNRLTGPRREVQESAGKSRGIDGQTAPDVIMPRMPYSMASADWQGCPSHEPRSVPGPRVNPTALVGRTERRGRTSRPDGSVIRVLVPSSVVFDRVTISRRRTPKSNLWCVTWGPFGGGSRPAVEATGPCPHLSGSGARSRRRATAASGACGERGTARRHKGRAPCHTKLWQGARFGSGGQI